LSAVDAFDAEFLVRFDVVLVAEFGREDDLAFAGDSRFHKGEISA
jgi:hypothetical protein